MPWVDSREIDAAYLSLTWRFAAEELDDALELADRLSVKGVEYEDGETAESPFTDIPLKPGAPYVRVYLPQQEAFRAELARRICQERGWPLEEKWLKSADWANAWKAYYKPEIFLDTWAVVPAWEASSPKDSVYTVWMDPGMAFGTGTHPTTRMCLTALAGLGLGGASVLDLGAGSGILGIFCARAGAARVVMADPDPVACDAMRHNAAINHLDPAVEIVSGTLDNVLPERFDVVACNVIWDVIQDVWPALDPFLSAKAVVLFSGILTEREAEVRRIAEALGHRVRRMEHQGGWLMAEVTNDSHRH